MNGSTLCPNTDLISDLGFDSLSLIRLVVDIEIEFGISVPDEFMRQDNIRKFGNIYRWVEKLISNL